MDVGIPEFLIVLIIILLIFGPNRIARLGGELGRTFRDFREGLEGANEGGGSLPGEKIDQNEKVDQTIDSHND